MRGRVVALEDSELPARDAELAAVYIASRVRAARGAAWLQGARPTPWSSRSTDPIVRTFAALRLWRVSDVVARAVVAWADGERPVELLRAMPAPLELLALQARGRRCVTLLGDVVAAAPDPEGLAFVLHDLCHLEKLVDPAHYVGEVGFFATVDRAARTPAWGRLSARYDDAWLRDVEHVVADMNGSAVFLFAALKMKLKMAARRRLARDLGRPAPTGGPLDAEESLAFAGALEAMLEALSLPRDVAEAARGVSAKRDAPEPALALLAHFEEVGRGALAGGGACSF